jgi:hypothetical protein
MHHRLWKPRAGAHQARAVAAGFPGEVARFLPSAQPGWELRLSCYWLALLQISGVAFCCEFLVAGCEASQSIPIQPENPRPAPLICLFTISRNFSDLLKNPPRLDLSARPTDVALWPGRSMLLDFWPFRRTRAGQPFASPCTGTSIPPLTVRYVFVVRAR